MTMHPMSRERHRGRGALRGLPRTPNGCTALLAVACALWLPRATLAAAPTLSHVFPAGGQRGESLVVTCTGSFDWPVEVWAQGVDAAPSKEKGKLEISIPADLAADRIWIRLHNAEGASAAIPFLIGNLKELAEAEPNNSPRDAQALTEPEVTINGVLDNADVDGFSVSLDAGHTLVADVDANDQLGSPIDAILQITSPDGFVLAENHDDIELDPRLAFTATRPGAYVVRLFAFPSAPDSTIAFHGGAQCVYRLSLTTGPFVTHAVPLSVPLAEPSAVEVFGWNIAPGTKLPVVPFGGIRLGEAQEFEPSDDVRNSADSRLGFAFGEKFGGSARVRLVPYEVAAELAQTEGGKPLVLNTPSSVTGWLRLPSQTDTYRLPLKKGQQAVVSVESRSLGFPLDPILRMKAPDGSTVASYDDPAPKRSCVMTHHAAVDGEYELTVRDRYRQGGDRCFYRLTVELEEPDFELNANADVIVVAVDKPTELVVNVKRSSAPGEAVGPITIEAVDLPPGVTVPAVVSELSGPTAEKVTLVFSATGPACRGRFRVIGKASLPKEINRFARTPLRFGACFESIWVTVIGNSDS